MYGELFLEFLVHTQNRKFLANFSDISQFLCEFNMTYSFKDTGHLGSWLLIRNILILLFFFAFSGIFGNYFVIHPFIAPSPYQLRSERKVSLYIDYYPSHRTYNYIVTVLTIFSKNLLINIEEV